MLTIILEKQLAPANRFVIIPSLPPFVKGKMKIFPLPKVPAKKLPVRQCPTGSLSYNRNQSTQTVPSSLTVMLMPSLT